MGYDAVIFRNIMDSLKLDYDNAVTDVISIFNDKVIKAVRETKLDEEGELIPSSTRFLKQKEWTRKPNETSVLQDQTTVTQIEHEAETLENVASVAEQASIAEETKANALEHVAIAAEQAAAAEEAEADAALHAEVNAGKYKGA